MERGRLADVLAQDPARMDPLVLAQIIGILQHSPTTKVLAGIAPLKSTFLNQVVEQSTVRNVEREEATG